MEVSGQLQVGVAGISFTFKLSSVVLLVLLAANYSHNINNVLDLGEFIRYNTAFFCPYIREATNGYSSIFDLLASLFR